MCAAVLLALSACGGGGDSNGTPPSEIGTLAYVVTECHDEPRGVFFERQALHVLHGDQDVTVMKTPELGPVFTGVVGLCRASTLSRDGSLSIEREAFQGLAVSPDGAAVVFEVSDDFSVNPPLPLHLPPEQKGIFFVGADGSDLRPLGPPSRLPFFVISSSGANFIGPGFAFSPDGRLVTFADTGPDAAGNEAGQVVTLDVYSRQRRQVTHLPPGVPPADFAHIPGVILPAFIDNQTIGFFTDAYGLTPTGNLAPFTVSLSDGTVKAAPLPVTLPDSQIIPTFFITGDKPTAIVLGVPGKPQNEFPGVANLITEVFAVDGPNLLQLTNFRRVDTGGSIFDVDRQTVYFSASANPFRSNPSENCQIFSIDRLGGDLRQLTQFSEAPHATSGCFHSNPPIVGCAEAILKQDPRTRMLVFDSTCDPLGTNNHFGAQIFAMHPDGSGLRQLTQTQGVVTQPDGTVTRELPGPSAYGPYLP
ncbi:MAG: hypothetical protein LAO77_18685 [Acidobacteriia bacterium]|nr:hypothetical protein [Terriglobia bacterium]